MAEIINGIEIMRRISELQQQAEDEFVLGLKAANPDITPEEIRIAVRAWYLDRPGAPYGDGVGRIGDPARFNDPK